MISTFSIVYLVFKSDLFLFLVTNKDTYGKDDGEGKEEPDTESMLLTVEALSAQLQEQTKLCKEQVSQSVSY